MPWYQQLYRSVVHNLFYPAGQISSARSIYGLHPAGGLDLVGRASTGPVLIQLWRCAQLAPDWFTQGRGGEQ